MAAECLGDRVREMSKGANVALAALSEDAASVVVHLSWSSAAGEGDADVSVLLLGPDGKVRDDGDFYFYNHPASPDGSVQLLGKTPAGNGSEDRVSLDLGAVPPGVERIVIAASQYGSGRFGDLEELRLTLADRSGELLLGYAIEDATDERAFLFGELYLREGAWKFRAIGQGYASGLAGLATDFGIDVDDEGRARTAAALPKAARRGPARLSGRARRLRGQTRPRLRPPPRPRPPHRRPNSPPSGPHRRPPRRPDPPAAALVRPRRRSPCPPPGSGPSRRTTPGAPPGSSRPPRSRATGSARRGPPRCCCRRWRRCRSSGGG